MSVAYLPWIVAVLIGVAALLSFVFGVRIEQLRRARRIAFTTIANPSQDLQRGSSNAGVGPIERVLVRPDPDLFAENEHLRDRLAALEALILRRTANDTATNPVEPSTKITVATATRSAAESGPSLSESLKPANEFSRSLKDRLRVVPSLPEVTNAQLEESLRRPADGSTQRQHPHGQVTQEQLTPEQLTREQSTLGIAEGA
jgi:hypothetical protein